MKAFIILTIVAVLISCGTSKQIADPEETIEITFLDTLDFTPETKISPSQKYPYRSSSLRLMDLTHTNLEVSFDWEQEAVIGRARLCLTPVYYSQEGVLLDAKNFKINSITDSLGQNLEYSYDEQQLAILFPNSIEKKDTVQIFIDYVAYPSQSGGSTAITSDRGLFFINSSGQDKETPSQIWTQGETENNSKWFPTIDKPNERCTQDISLTVDNKYQTLSNGLMVSSVDNGDGTRTDRWVQDKPHAPYLFMLAIGDFGVQKESWENIELSYYVDKPYQVFAKDIFGHTPEMLDFFSNILSYHYPWDKYAQVVVKDFVSGAMENTTAVIFGDFVQKDKRALVDNGNDAIVAHELFHHWFGDLVTCESWANLTLNEGFANYSEYLWFEHKYGKDRAELHRYNEMQTYLYTSEGGNTHPLIHYHYADKEDMFDAHSYNKGGLVLHMLRNYLGDGAFFSSLNKYLVDNAYSAVEVDELRMAFEDTVGEDLNWFFDQWYLAEGHPILEYDYLFDTNTNVLSIDMEQVQDPENHFSPFILPMTLQIIYPDGSSEYLDYVMTESKVNVPIELNKEPLLVLPDAQGVLLMEILHSYNIEESLAMFQYAENYTLRYRGLNNLSSEEFSDSFIVNALKDPHHIFRRYVLENLSEDQIKAHFDIIRSLAVEDPHSQVREAAIDCFPISSNPINEQILLNTAKTDSSYLPILSAINIMRQIDMNKAKTMANSVEKSLDSKVISTVAQLYANDAEEDHSSFFIHSESNVNFYHITSFYRNLNTYCQKTDKLTLVKILSSFEEKYFEKNQVMTKLQIINLFKSIKEDDADINRMQQSFYRLVRQKELNDFLLSKIPKV